MSLICNSLSDHSSCMSLSSANKKDLAISNVLAAKEFLFRMLRLGSLWNNGRSEFVRLHLSKTKKALSSLL